MFIFFNDTATTEIYTLSLHDALPISGRIEEMIADVVRELQASHEVEAVGIGAAGFVDADRSTVVFAPNLAWRDEPLRVNVEKRCGLPVVVENDANAASWRSEERRVGKEGR